MFSGDSECEHTVNKGFLHTLIITVNVILYTNITKNHKVCRFCSNHKQIKHFFF